VIVSARGYTITATLYNEDGSPLTRFIKTRTQGVKKKITLPQFGQEADAEVFGNKITVRYEGNESFPRGLKLNEQYYVVIDGVEKTMMLVRKPMGSWQFTIQ
jgi:hypothetical protein